MASIVLYSIASAACGFSHTIPQLATFRFLLGLGMGGEWTAGAALIAETWRAEHRGKALGLMQSTYAIGEAIAALVVALVLPHFGWRAVFFVGVLPALLVFWIRRRVPEPALWKQRPRVSRPHALKLLLDKNVLRVGTLATTMNACAMFGYWGLFTWIPAYLSLPVIARRARLGTGEDDDVFSSAVFWQVARICDVRILRRHFWPPQAVLPLFADRCRVSSRVWLGEEPILASAAWSFSGVLSELDFFPATPPSPAKFFLARFVRRLWG